MQSITFFGRGATAKWSWLLFCKKSNRPYSRLRRWSGCRSYLQLFVPITIDTNINQFLFVIFAVKIIFFISHEKENHTFFYQSTPSETESDISFVFPDVPTKVSVTFPACNAFILSSSYFTIVWSLDSIFTTSSIS